MEDEDIYDASDPSEPPSPAMEAAASRAQTLAPEEEASRGRIPKYGGDPTKYRAWKQKAQLYLVKAMKKGEDDALRLITLLESLEGSAFTTVTQGDVESCVNFENGQAKIPVSQVFARLEERYDGVVSRDEAMARLQLERQNQRTLDEYTASFEELWALSGQSDSKTKCRMFYQGLNYSTRNPLDSVGFLPENVKYDDLWQVVSKASKATKKKDGGRDGGRGGPRRGRGGRGGGSARGRGAQTDEGVETRTCYYCDKPGHLKKDCRRMAADNRSTQGNGRGRGRGGATGRSSKAITTGRGEDQPAEEVYSDDE